MTAADSPTGAHRILPVVVAAGADQGLRTADALAAGGLPVAEFTFRLEGAADALRAVARERPDVVVGAGTIISQDQVDVAADAGAQFIVSPGTSKQVLERAHARGLAVVPGVATASDVMRALDHGSTTLKLFPAAAVGGLPTLAALAAPFPQARFVPTGGIGEDDAAAWLAHPAVLAIGGSWMVSRALIEAGNWDEITRRTAAAVRIANDATKEATR